MAKKKVAPPRERIGPVGPPKRVIDLKWISVDQIVPNPDNPNQEDEATFELLKDEIAEVGFIDPVQVVPIEDGMYMLLGGEHRWRAAKELGHDEIPCALLTDAAFQERDLRRFILVRLNVIKGKLDPEKFLRLYKELKEKYGEEPMQRLLGYSNSKEFQKMLGWVKRGLKDSLPKEMNADVEKALKETKTMADVGSVIQELFQKYGDTVAQSFMVFDYGKSKHVYVTLNAKSRRALDRLVDAWKMLKCDVNDQMLPVIEEFAKRAAIDVERKMQEEAVGGVSDSSVDPKESWD